MKRILLGGNQYKTNLHCHTVYSDGKLTPAEVKDVYRRHGYSAVAYTDHDIFVPHDELTDENFVALHGYEMEITEPGEDFDLLKCCHLCFIAKDRDHLTPASLHHAKYMFGGAPAHFDEMAPFEGDFEREYTPECINELIRRNSEAGFFVTYNHPDWSLEDYPQYSQYRGMDAMEIYNGMSLRTGYGDYNPRVYDDLLRLGNRIGVLGTDDNHDEFPEGSPYFDSCVAWTSVFAKELTYEGLIDGLTSGTYYASSGPVITALFVEDGVMRVECGKAREVLFTTDTRRRGYTAGGEEGVTEAEFRLSPKDKYIRVTVIGFDGSTACTRAYFADEISD